MMIREVGKWYLYVVVVEAVESGASASSRQMYVFVVIVVVDSLRPWRLGPSRTRNTETLLSSLRKQRAPRFGVCGDREDHEMDPEVTSAADLCHREL